MKSNQHITQNEPITSAWKDFAATTMAQVPADSDQYRHMRNTFFAGAFVVADIVSQLGSDEMISLDKAMTVFKAVHQDVRDYFSELERQLIERN